MDARNLCIELLLGGEGGPGQGGMTCGGSAAAYLRAELATAAPHQLQVLLYDGAIRLCRQAVAALDDGDASAAADRLARVRAILRQLRGVLRCEAASALRQELSELYERTQQRLIEADYYRRREVVSEMISMLSYERPAWTAFVEALCRQGTALEALQSGGDWLA